MDEAPVDAETLQKDGRLEDEGTDLWTTMDGEGDLLHADEPVILPEWHFILHPRMNRSYF